MKVARNPPSGGEVAREVARAKKSKRLYGPSHRKAFILLEPPGRIELPTY